MIQLQCERLKGSLDKEQVRYDNSTNISLPRAIQTSYLILHILSLFLALNKVALHERHIYSTYIGLQQCSSSVQYLISASIFISVLICTCFGIYTADIIKH